MKRRSNVVQASELTEYGYCARSWHLRRVVGVDPQNNRRRSMRDGMQAHRRHSARVALVPALRTLSIVLLLAAAGVAAFTLLG